MKKILALLLATICAVVPLFALAGCGSGDTETEDVGAEIRAYFVGELYDFDPAKAYTNDEAMKIMSLIYDRAYPGYKPAISVIQKSTIDVDTDIIERVDLVEDIEHSMPYVIDPAKFDQDALLQIMGDVYDNIMEIITESIGLDGDDIRVIKETYRHSEVEV